MLLWNDESLRKLFLNRTPLIDVRAPIEFDSGSIPFSTNLPIMINEERAQVGTRYKEEGQEAAIRLGHDLVSGKVKEARIEAWRRQIQENPETQVFCFRGGLRSQIACQWLRESGIDRRPIEGGYKRLRQFFLSWIEEAPLPKLYRIGGLTGTGKTTFLKRISYHIDLEGLANHRGSAFGGHGIQPAQITFENHLALELLNNHSVPHIVVEDESATIGRVTLPQRFFSHHRQSPIILLKVDDDQRISNIFEDYVKDSNAAFFLENLLRIKKRVSNADYLQLTTGVERAFAAGMEIEDHRPWISNLLKLYYDPLYQRDLKRNADLIVFEGNAQEVQQYLTSL